MPLDDDACDPEEIAYHEAGHATAAVLCVAGWTEAKVDVDAGPGSEFFDGMDNGWTAYVAQHYGDTTAENRAFIAWAGSWAEARYLDPDDPWRVLPDVQQTGGSSDMVRVYDYWRDAPHDPHDTEEHWAQELDSAWSHVEALARQLARQHPVRSRLHPEELFEDGDWTPPSS